VRILALDHFFDQDLAALRSALGPGEQLDVLPYQRLHRLARRHFPAAAFEGLDNAVELPPEAWAGYRAAAARAAHWWTGAYRPNVFVVPSDAIFYVRPLIEAFARMTVPTVVVQKETSISPMVMDDHSAAVARTVPFLSVAMTVCSERNRDFWVLAGTPPDAITVTGQPRFDVYAQLRSEKGSGTKPPRLLYLSYDDRAYLPSDIGVAYEGTWRDLRRETEQVIAAAAAEGRWRVTVKRHPQQLVADEWLGPVEHAARDADTRQLILAADAIVGFQTTANFEAVVACKPVLYPAWGPVFEEVKTMLLPFHAQPGVVTHVRSPADLEAELRRAPGDLPAPTANGRVEAEEQLGPVDGRAADRVLAVLRQHAGSEPRDWARPERRQIARAGALGLAAPGLRAAGALAQRLGRLKEGAAAGRRAEHWEQELREARNQVRQR